jgi:hypothetical protein
MAKAFDKKALFAALKPKTELVPVDGFGDLSVKQLTISEVEALRATVKEGDKSNKFALSMVLASVVDDSGALVFDESDRAQLESSSNAPIDRLVAKALEVNGFKKAPDAKN